MYAFLAVAEDGALVVNEPQRVGHAVSTDEDNALWQTLGTFADLLDEIRPDRIALLLPGTGTNARQTHGALAPRVELETLLRMAAARSNRPVERLSHAGVRSRLGLSRSGPFEVVVRARIPRVGDYWTAGRLFASAAALAARGS